MERQFIFKKFDLAQLADGYRHHKPGRPGAAHLLNRTAVFDFDQIAASAG
jgi:hypothetical protein